MSVAAPEALGVGPNITSLVPYRPGKPIEEVKRELGLTDVIKLASNENSLGPSPLALRAIQEAAKSVHLYPDAGCFALRQAVSKHLGIPEDWLIFGNGSDDIIHLLGVTFLTPGDEVILSHPSFVRYEAAAILHSSHCHKLPLKDWTYNLAAMAERINDRTRLIFIANPNNPTGTSVTAAEVDEFLNHVPERAIVVFDEAYYEFADRPNFPDTLAYIRNGRNIMTLRTYSKAYGLAGIRLGYGISTPAIVSLLDQVREPFNVSSIAQAAGVAALEDTEFLGRTIDINRAGKTAFYTAFRQMGLDFCETDANFVWVDVGRDCREVFDGLLRQGVIVRTGDIFGAPTHLRVTIGTPEENSRFLRALGKILGK